MPVNKVVYGGRILIDLTSDTVTASVLSTGYTAHLKNGTKVTGTFKGVDTSDATAIASDIASGKTAYVNGKKITGIFVDQRASDEIKQILTNGLTETIIAKNSGVSGLKVTKTSLNNDLTHTAILTNQNGTEIGRTTKVFSNDSLVITTTDNTGRKLVETINSAMTSSVSVLTNSSGTQIGKVTKTFTTDGMTTITSYTYVL